MSDSSRLTIRKYGSHHLRWQRKTNWHHFLKMFVLLFTSMEANVIIQHSTGWVQHNMFFFFLLLLHYITRYARKKSLFQCLHTDIWVSLLRLIPFTKIFAAVQPLLANKSLRIYISWYVKLNQYIFNILNHTKLGRDWNLSWNIAHGSVTYVLSWVICLLVILDCLEHLYNSLCYD